MKLTELRLDLACVPLEKEMATHSSILAWNIPWMEEPGWLQSMGSQRVRHNWATSLTHSLACVQSTSVSYLCSPDGLRGGSLSKKNFKDIHQRFLTLRQEETLIRKNWCKADKLQGKWCLTLKASVQFSCSVVSYSLRPHESEHARPPCPSPTTGVHPDSRPSSQWCHPAIASSVVPFSSCPQSLPASESFPMSQLFTWGGQSTGVSASASFLPKKPQGWSSSEWTGWISLQSKGLSRVFSNTKLPLNYICMCLLYV